MFETWISPTTSQLKKIEEKLEAASLGPKVMLESSNSESADNADTPVEQGYSVLVYSCSPWTLIFCYIKSTCNKESYTSYITLLLSTLKCYQMC